MPDGLRIVSLEVDNVKRLHAVHIKPDGDIIIIGGKNAAGKSSVLDAIEMALGGKKSIPRRPVRNGEESAHVVCDLGTLIVRRKFTSDGKTSVVVETKDGAKYATPQAILDDLVGRLSFDPLEFTRLDPPKQLEVLRDLVGLDLQPIEDARDEFYRRRAEHNRTAKSVQGRLDGCNQWPDAPDEEVSISKLIRDLEDAEELDRLRRRRDEQVKDLEGYQVRVQARIDDSLKQIGEWQKTIATDKASLVTEGKALEEKKKEAATALAAVPDMAAIRARLDGAEEINGHVRDNAAHAVASTELKSAKLRSDECTKAIGELDEKKRGEIEGANFPIDGLALDGDGITFGGIPFEQASRAEQLRVSVAIGIAMNPKLRVLLIRDGSLLDEESMVLLAQLAKDADAQVWLERVGTGDASAVIIEDGSVLRKGG